jgi:hypothetical protein
VQIGIDSFAAAISDPATGLALSPVERMQHLLEEIELADQVGLDIFGVRAFGCNAPWPNESARTGESCAMPRWEQRIPTIC